MSKSCSRCNAGMPSFRVNPLCEECFAEESDEYDDEADDGCMCGDDECPECGRSCSECRGEGWGILGDDFSNTDPLWDGPDGQIIECPNCHGSGLAKDMTYW